MCKCEQCDGCKNNFSCGIHPELETKKKTNEKPPPGVMLILAKRKLYKRCDTVHAYVIL